VKLQRPKTGPGLQAEMNVTPLVDVVLVLLIIFMVITPFLQRGVEIDLPYGQHVQSREDAQREPLVVSLKRDGSLYLGTERVSKRELLDRVRAILGPQADREILLKADERLRYGQVREIFEWLRSGGAHAVSLATEIPEGQG
jgi:biopolymer transport protein ExbD